MIYRTISVEPKLLKEFKKTVKKIGFDVTVREVVENLLKRFIKENE